MKVSKGLRGNSLKGVILKNQTKMLVLLFFQFGLIFKKKKIQSFTNQIEIPILKGK